MTPNRCSIQRSPAGQLVSVDTGDFDEFLQNAPGWNIEYQLIGANPPHSTIDVAMTPSVQFGLVRHAAGYCSQGQNPTGTLSFAVPCTEMQPMIYRGHEIASMGMALIRSGVEFELFCGSGAHFLIASFLRERVERYIADVWQWPQLRRLEVDLLCFPDEERRERCRVALRRLLIAVKADPSLLNDQTTTALLEDKILETLLLRSSVDPDYPAERSRHRIARRAYRYLRDRIDDVPSIRELCAATRASYATLERAFRETYGITPKSLLNELRLSRVRTALLHPSPSTTVTDVALRWGFVEFGRFSAYYRQRYYEMPSETLGRTRGILTTQEAQSPNVSWPPE